ncbi:hypothetical protein BKA64DRAFT_756726, partial [Cadophora sp. MPI-SDFR-AT-0126]
FSKKSFYFQVNNRTHPFYRYKKDILVWLRIHLPVQHQALNEEFAMCKVGIRLYASNHEKWSCDFCTRATEKQKGDRTGSKKKACKYKDLKIVRNGLRKSETSCGDAKCKRRFPKRDGALQHEKFSSMEECLLSLEPSHGECSEDGRSNDKIKERVDEWRSQVFHDDEAVEVCPSESASQVSRHQSDRPRVSSSRVSEAGSTRSKPRSESSAGSFFSLPGSTMSRNTQSNRRLLSEGPPQSSHATEEQSSRSSRHSDSSADSFFSVPSSMSSRRSESSASSVFSLPSSTSSR